MSRSIPFPVTNDKQFAPICQRPDLCTGMMQELLSGLAAYLMGLPDSPAADGLTDLFHGMLDDLRNLEGEWS